jgi:hypothetical protein
MSCATVNRRKRRLRSHRCVSALAYPTPFLARIAIS